MTMREMRDWSPVLGEPSYQTPKESESPQPSIAQFHYPERPTEENEIREYTLLHITYWADGHCSIYLSRHKRRYLPWSEVLDDLRDFFPDETDESLINTPGMCSHDDFLDEVYKKGISDIVTNESDGLVYFLSNDNEAVIKLNTKTGIFEYSGESDL